VSARAQVATNPYAGQVFKVSAEDARSSDQPNLEIVAPWKRLEGKKHVVLEARARHAAPDPLTTITQIDASLYLHPQDPAPHGAHELVEGSVTSSHDPKRGTITLKFEGVLREGNLRHPKEHRVKVRCSFEGLPLTIYE